MEKDRKFSKSFINDITSTLVSENAELTTEEEQSNKQNDEAKIWVPKPRGHYCRVCNVDFKNYLKHINGQEHKSLWRQSNSVFNLSYFSELVRKYNPQK